MGYEADYQMPLADYYDELANEVNAETRQAEFESHGCKKGETILRRWMSC